MENGRAKNKNAKKIHCFQPDGFWIIGWKTRDIRMSTWALGIFEPLKKKNMQRISIVNQVFYSD